MRRRVLLWVFILANCVLVAFGAMSQRPDGVAKSAEAGLPAASSKTTAEIKAPAPKVETGKPIVPSVVSGSSESASIPATESVDSQATQDSGDIAAIPAKTLSRKATGGKFGPGVNPDTKKSPEKALTTDIPALRVFLSLAFVAGLMALTFYLLKRFGAKMSGLDSKGGLQVKSRVHLDHKASLAIVRVHEEELLLAVTSSGVSLLSRYSAIASEAGTAELDDLAISGTPSDGEFQTAGKLAKNRMEETGRGRGS